MDRSRRLTRGRPQGVERLIALAADLDPPVGQAHGLRRRQFCVYTGGMSCIPTVVRYDMSIEKISISLPAELLAEARTYAGSNLSAYVADSLRRRILADRLGQYLDELDAEFGALTEDELAEARRLWRNEV